MSKLSSGSWLGAGFERVVKMATKGLSRSGEDGSEKSEVAVAPHGWLRR